MGDNVCIVKLETHFTGGITQHAPPTQGRNSKGKEVRTFSAEENDIIRDSTTLKRQVQV